MKEEKVEEIMKQIKDLPGYVFELTANLGSERTFSIRGNFPVGVELKSMNDELDKLVKATDRQLSKACLPSLEEDLAKAKDQLKNFERNLEMVQKKTKNHTTLPVTAQNEIEGAKTNIEVQKAMIARKEKFIEKTRQDAT